jgi:GxxExxY protein
MHVATHVGLPVVYDGEKIELGYRIDLVVENLVIVELKCVEAIHPVHQAQLLSYAVDWQAGWFIKPISMLRV